MVIDDSGTQSCTGDKFGKPSGLRYVPFDPTVEKYTMIASMVVDSSGKEMCMMNKTRTPGGINYMALYRMVKNQK